MGHSPKKCTLELEKEQGSILAKVRFLYRDDLDLKRFADFLSANILQERKLEAVIDEGYPPNFNRNLLLMEKPFLDKAQTALQAFKKQFPDEPGFPGMLDHFFFTKKSRRWFAYMKKRMELGKENESLSICQIVTFWDQTQPLLAVASKVHTEEQLVSHVEQVARSLDITLTRKEGRPSSP